MGQVLHLKAMNNGCILFFKSFMIGDNVNADQNSAHFADGVLEVVAPKQRKFPYHVLPSSYDTTQQDKSPAKHDTVVCQSSFQIRRVAISEERPTAAFDGVVASTKTTKVAMNDTIL
jgi:hypothetical protein